MNIVRLGLIGVVLVTACRSDAFDQRALVGDWRVTDVYCRTCEHVDRSEIGLVMKMSEHDVVDPLGGGECLNGAGYRRLPESSNTRETAISKLDPDWKASESRRMEVVAVTCRDLDFLVLVVLGNKELGYSSEGEISYRLVKSDSPIAKDPR